MYLYVVNYLIYIPQDQAQRLGCSGSPVGGQSVAQAPSVLWKAWQVVLMAGKRIPRGGMVIQSKCDHVKGQVGSDLTRPDPTLPCPGCSHMVGLPGTEFLDQNTMGTHAVRC